MVSWHVHQEWSEVASIWLELLSETPHQIFQQLDVQKGWWESTSKRPLLFVVIRENEKAVALFPFVKDEQTLQLLGDRDVSDYLDVIVLPGKESVAYEGLGKFLTQEQWDNITLTSIKEHSPTVTWFPQLAERNGWQIETVQQDVCPIIELPSTWEEYLQDIGKKQRHEIKRKWQRLEEQARVTFRVITDTQQNPQALETFFTLHKLSSVEKAAFWTEEHRQFFDKLSAAASNGGWLRLYFLDVNGKPAAAMYCFDFNDELLIYNSGFDAAAYQGTSVGNVLTAYTIQHAIQTGKKRYNFLRGGEEYKLRYRAIPHPVFDMTLRRTS